jgi:PAS domain S-box-containing protein
MDIPISRRSAALYAITRILADAATIEDAAPQILSAIGEALGWEIGALWIVDASADRLRCVSVWESRTLDAAEFVATTRTRTFERGIGLPGRVWTTATAAWITDVADDANFPRFAAAARAGLHSALAFPACLGDRCLGVIEFLTSTTETPDDDLLRLMTSVGTQIGQFIERERIEAAARRTEATNAAIVAGALDCIVTMDHEGRIVEFNPAAERTFGHARHDVIGRLMADVIIPPALRERHRAGLTQYLGGGEARVLGRRIEITALRADGHEFPVELTIIRLPSDDSPLFTGFIRDITERHRAESERAASLGGERDARRAAEEAEGRAAFLAEAGILLSRSLDYATTFANIVRLAVPDFADWCAAHVVEDDGSIRCVALTHRDPDVTNVAWPYVREYRFDPDAPEGGPRVIRSGQSVLYPNVPDDLMERMARDAEDLRIRRLLGLGSVIAVPLVASGRVLGALAFVMSESGRRYEAKDLAFAEDLARRAALAVDNALLYRDAQAANQLKDEFLATLSHELRTPLTAIIGWTRMLTAGQVAESERDRALRVIERNANKQKAIVDDLLDMSRIITGRLRLDRRSVNLGALIEGAVDTIRPTADAKDIAITLEIESTIRASVLVADPDRLQQVFWNLLSNAVKFTPKSGRVRIRSAVVDSDALIEVSDTGEGIDAATLPHVFERFRQADSSSRRWHGGLGLGLAIVRQLVELHGGTVDAKSEGRGRGTTFSVRLPMSMKSADPIAATAHGIETGAPRLSDVRVLVVEDDADTCDLLRTMLERAGATVRVAGTASDALSVITTSPIDVLVADIGLPGKNGNDLLGEARRLSPRRARLPAIAVTAYADEQHRALARTAGFEAFLAKPVEPAELVRTIGRVLASVGSSSRESSDTIGREGA